MANGKKRFDKAYKNYAQLDRQVKEMKTGGPSRRYILSVPTRFARLVHKCSVRSSVSSLVPLPDLNTEGNPGYIVSLTSFPARIPGLPATIRSLFLQDLLPCEIVLWLCEKEFEGTDKKLPRLDEFRSRGLRVEFVREDFKPHLKYYHAFKEYRDKNIITVDDDLIYPPDTFSRLADLAARYPGAVCANRVRKIVAGQSGMAPYSSWQNYNTVEPECCDRFIALGYGGVLYPPGEYRGKFLGDTLFLRLAPRADDLWLKAVEICVNIPVATGSGYFPHPITVKGSQKVSLLKTNLDGAGNDNQWEMLDKHFGINQKLHGGTR